MKAQEEILKAIQEDARSANTSVVCTWGYTYETADHVEKPALYRKQICHHALGKLGASAATATFIFSSLYINHDEDIHYKGLKEQAKEFWEFLADPLVSPWRMIKPKLMLDKDNYPYAISLWDHPRNMANQVVGNLFIAARIPLEYPLSLKLWHKLVQDGFSRTDALFLISSAAFSRNPTKKCEIIAAPGAHFPFDGYYHVSYRRLLDGTPKFRGNQTFGNRGCYRPCNVIWDAERVADDYSDKGANWFYKTLEAKQEYTGILQGLHRAEGTLEVDRGKIVFPVSREYTYQTFVELVRKNWDRLTAL